ncbi:glycosyl hydrolase family 65 protein [Vallitalea okinawensis]|uniref:glycosyl hydrolase family 65 protein n=1 Tax=Vallitalea okinawensis TaxID=2078660 RepID=UPI000CFD4F86|nr:glycosyl hydrolase family 65 protein [Vallitalea okinawensis]
MGWILTNKDYNKSDNKHYEGAYAQGNGYLNLRATFDEDLSEASQDDVYWRLPANVTLEKQRHPLSKWGTYIPGIYGNHPILGEEIINLPYALGMNMIYEDERFDMNQSMYTDFERKLNLRNGSLERKFHWSINNNVIKVNVQRYCSMAIKNMIVQRTEITSEKDGILEISHFIDTGVTTNGYNHFNKIDLDEEEFSAYLITDTNQEVGLCVDISISQGTMLENRIHKVENRIYQHGSLDLKANEKVIIEKRIYYATSIDDEYCGDIGKHLQNNINIGDSHNEFEKHNRIWAEKWEKSDIEIGGNEKLQKAVRFSIYHLLRSVNEKDHVAIDAKAYAGEAYYGHYFWDTEVYLLPFFIYTQPEYAKKLIRYRYNTLKGAKENAKRYGYNGAKFSWESCISGKEQCSNWQYADLEVHVTADVIYGLLHYCKNMNDQEFLLNEGLEMLMETARYWMERVYEEEGTYHLRGVMGPDEYLPFTNNNTFTNYMVRFTLQATIDTIAFADEKNKTLLRKLNITEDEVLKIKDIVQNMVLLIDDKKGFINQCENFSNFEDIDMDKIWTDKSRPFGQFISQERNYRSKALKQADVIALLYLFRKDFNNTMKKHCMDYYEPLTTHDSSLSYIFHALVYSDLSDSENAYDMFAKSIGIDMEEKGAAEGIHIANCGGIWQGLIMGFGGMKNSFESDQLSLSPRLPKEIEYMSFKIFYKGYWYRIYCDHKKTLVKKVD